MSTKVEALLEALAITLAIIFAAVAVTTAFAPQRELAPMDITVYEDGSAVEWDGNVLPAGSCETITTELDTNLQFCDG